MPRFDHPAGKVEVSCSDDSGRGFRFKFPCETESPTEIGLLRKLPGVTEALAPAPVSAPEPLPEPATESESKPALKAAKPKGGEE